MFSFHSASPRFSHSHRRPSQSSLLGSPTGSRPGSPVGKGTGLALGAPMKVLRSRGGQLRVLVFVGTVIVLFVYITGDGSAEEGTGLKALQRRSQNDAERREVQVALSPARSTQARGSSQEGYRTSTDGTESLHSLEVLIRPSESSPPSRAAPSVRENVLLPIPFSGALSEHLPLLFSYPSTPLKLPSSPSSPAVALELPIHRPSAPRMPAHELWFSICTSPQRAIDFSPVWEHFMGSLKEEDAEEEEGEGRPGCLITDAVGVRDEDGHRRANEHLERIGSRCRMSESSRSGERYEMRVLGLIRDAWIESEKRRWQEGGSQVEWFVFGDDDTWWSDINLVRSLLEGYNPSEDHYLGAFSEAVENFADNGRISYGGAGIIVSRSLVRKMQPMVERCAAKFANVWGGDGLISHCAAWTMRTPLEHVVSEVPALKQMDIRGDASGYLASGAAPYLSLHHWASWLTLFPASVSRSPLSSITLLAQAAKAVGGRNFLRRFIFDGGLVSYSVGYAITIYRNPLTVQQLGQVERTWEGLHPHRPSREAILEGEGKRTYYLHEVLDLGAGKTMFRHVCEDDQVQEGLREMRVVWDVSENVVEVSSDGASRWREWLRSGRSENMLNKGEHRAESKSGHELDRAQRRQRRIR